MCSIMPSDPIQTEISMADGIQKPSSDGLPVCGAKTRSGKACQNFGMKNGRCRMHGGKSTGPRTPEGKERHRLAVTKHGARSLEMILFRREVRQVRAAAKKLAKDARGLPVELG